MIEVKENPEDYHADLVNYCQRHKCNSLCLRRNKITKQIECRHKFPKKHADKSFVLVSEYSRNRENQDIYYKVDIVTKRNDQWLNEFFRPILDHWQVC